MSDEIDRLHNRIDQLDAKVTDQIDDLRTDLYSWLHGDNQTPGIATRLDRVEQFQKSRRKAELAVLGAFSSIVSGTITYISTLFTADK